MVERFFNGGGSCRDEGIATLLSGPPACGKTSLLFQYALNKASANSNSHSHSHSHSGNYVVFLCSHRRFHANPPFLSQGTDSSSQIFKRIHIKYVDSADDLTKYFAAFHLLDPSPVAVILDDFADFFHHSECQQRYNNARGRDLAMLRVLALAHTSITHANKTAPCNLLLSDTHHRDSPKLLFVYKRWVSSVFTVQGDASGSFLLNNSICFGGHNTAKKTAKYSIALQYLVLEGFVGDAQL